METDPYAAPSAAVSDLASRAPEPHVDITGPIRHTVILGCVLLVLSLVQALVLGDRIVGAWWLLDAAVVAGLTFGVHRRSRVCAVLLLAYYVVARFLGQPGGIVVALLLTVVLVRGVRATFAFHHWVADWPRQEAERAARNARLAEAFPSSGEVKGE